LSESWSGRVGFIAAAIASAVGLGSIWKFPYEVGANGGAAFVVFYIAGLALAVVPLLLAEFAIGRRGGADAATSIARVAAAHGAGRGWMWAGVLGVVCGALVLSFYSVIGGWTLAYTMSTAAAGLPGADAQAVQARYDALLASPGRMIAYHAVFLAAAAAVVARGVSRGIEAASMVLMPLLFVLVAGLALYSAVQGDLRGTLRFLFALDLERFTAHAALEALGLGFFSIGVGFGLMITYAAYAGQGIALFQVALATVLVDTAISLAAGLAVFPLVFANGLDPASGPGLVFVTLPLAFVRMPLGEAAAVAFFLLLFVAALASAISMLELAVALVTRRAGWSRPRAAAAIAGVCFVAGLATVFSFNLWANWHPLGAIPDFAEATAFDLLDHLTSNFLLPVGGVALALFAGWALPESLLRDELRLGARGTRALRILMRWATPALIVVTAVAPALF
jgi:NSS family neurotransmitter:Na+ symporter